MCYIPEVKSKVEEKGQILYKCKGKNHLTTQLYNTICGDSFTESFYVIMSTFFSSPIYLPGQTMDLKVHILTL
jgi:hypothetical protein